MGAKIRLGFVGAGHMGQCAHLKNYAALPDCEVVALAEVREQTGRAVAQRHGIPSVYRTPEEMFKKEKLDGIVASQQFSRHGVLVPELLKARLPVLIEKPLAGSIASAERVLSALSESGTFVMVAYHKRSDPATEYAKKEIDRLKSSGELGKMKYVRVTMPAGDWIASGYTDLVALNEKPPAPLPSDPPPSDMDAQAFKDYTAFVNYYIHQVNLIRFLLGEDYAVKYADPSGVLLAGLSASGVACSLEMSPYQTTIDWQERALVAFEKGFVKIELPAPLASNRPGRVTIFRDPGDGVVPQTIEPQLPWIHAMRNQAANFAAAVRGDRKPPCDAIEALKDLKLAREYLRLWKGV
jgi:predicted dehydrogenase